MGCLFSDFSYLLWTYCIHFFLCFSFHRIEFAPASCSYATMRYDVIYEPAPLHKGCPFFSKQTNTQSLESVRNNFMCTSQTEWSRNIQRCIVCHSIIINIIRYYYIHVFCKMYPSVLLCVIASTTISCIVPFLFCIRRHRRPPLMRVS